MSHSNSSPWTIPVRFVAIGSALGLIALVDIVVSTPELRERPWSIAQLAGPVFLAGYVSAMLGGCALVVLDLLLRAARIRVSVTRNAVPWVLAAGVVAYLAVDEVASTHLGVRPFKSFLRGGVGIATILAVAVVLRPGKSAIQTAPILPRIERALAVLPLPAGIALGLFLLSAPPTPVAATQDTQTPPAYNDSPRFEPEPDDALASVLEAADRSRILLLCLDGLEPERIERGIAEGRLPTLASISAGGLGGSLRTLIPTFSPRIWTSVVTGVAPERHGIEDFYLYQLPRLDLVRLRLRRSLDAVEETLDLLGGLERVPVTSTLRRSKALWNLADEAGLRSAVIGLWATWPAEPLEHGFVISDRASRARTQEWLARDLISSTPGTTTFPRELADRLADLQGDPNAVTRGELSGFLEVDDALWRTFEQSRAITKRVPISIFRSSHLNDAFHLRSAERLWREEQLDLCIVYARLVDDLGHFYYDRDDELGIIDRGYEWLDRALAPLIDEVRKDPRTLIVLASDHGWSLGDDDEYHHRDAPEGVLLFHGHGVRDSAVSFPDASVYDIAPTILTRLGLPLSEELVGRSLDELFTRAIEASRVTRYGSRTRGSAPRARRSTTDATEMRRLIELGYAEE